MTTVNTNAAFSSGEVISAVPENKSFSLSVIDSDGADPRINLAINAAYANGGANSGTHNIISADGNGTEITIYKHVLNGADLVQLYAPKSDLSKAYICTQFDYQNATELKIVAVDESGAASDDSGSSSNTTAKVSGTVAIDGTAAARDVIVISNASSGRELVAETTSEADGTFSVEWSNGWTGSVIALAIDAYGDDWSANNTVSVGDIMHPSTANGYVYKCTIAGATGDDEPTWSTDGTTSVIDGGVTWAPQPFYRPVGSGPIQPEVTYPDGTQPWTPDALESIALWLDATDAETITEDVGVSVWSDKSGNGNDAAQISTASQPAYAENAINGKAGINFDGVDDYLTMVTPDDIKANSEKTMFAICDITENDANGRFDFVMSSRPYSGSSAWGYIYFARNYSDNELGYSHTGWGDAKTATDVLTTGPALICITTQADAAGAIPYINGTQYPLAISTLASQVTDNTETTIGRQSANFAEGPTGMVLVFNKVLTEEERQKVEGYIMHHFAMSSSLPEDHPYKSSAPTV
jgi:hypothetical protein